MSMKMLCALHNKNRNMECLQENPPGSGVYTCVPGYECKGGSGAPSQGVMMCQVHFKRRNLESLMDVWTPNGVVFQCRPDAQCKMGGPNRYHPYMGMGGHGYGDPHAQMQHPQQHHAHMGYQPMPPVQALCITHNKNRGLENLQQHPTIPGAFECRPDMQCKGAQPQHSAVPTPVPVASAPLTQPVQEARAERESTPERPAAAAPEQSDKAEPKTSKEESKEKDAEKKEAKQEADNGGDGDDAQKTNKDQDDKGDDNNN